MKKETMEKIEIYENIIRSFLSSSDKNVSILNLRAVAWVLKKLYEDGDLPIFNVLGSGVDYVDEFGYLFNDFLVIDGNSEIEKNQSFQSLVSILKNIIFDIFQKKHLTLSQFFTVLNNVFCHGEIFGDNFSQENLDKVYDILEKLKTLEKTMNNKK